MPGSGYHRIVLEPEFLTTSRSTDPFCASISDIGQRATRTCPGHHISQSEAIEVIDGLDDASVKHKSRGQNCWSTVTRQHVTPSLRSLVATELHLQLHNTRSNRRDEQAASQSPKRKLVTLHAPCLLSESLHPAHCWQEEEEHAAHVLVPHCKRLQTGRLRGGELCA